MIANKKSKIKGAQFYKVGDKVETIRTDIGAWFDADIIDISPNSKCECDQECDCTYKLVLEGVESDDLIVLDRKVNEIRPVSYSSIPWGDLEVGMRVVINYNIEQPKDWGYWYDYIIDDLQKRNDIFYLKGTLLVGFNGSLKKLSVSIDSDHVADVLKVEPHVNLKEKERGDYETGVKPEYCKKCKNRPKVKCRTCCCCKCGAKEDFHLTVQCDECADWYHIYCMKPPLKKLPDDEDWYCPKCNNEAKRARLEMKLMNKRKNKNGTKKHPIKNSVILKNKVNEEKFFTNQVPQLKIANEDGATPKKDGETTVEIKKIPKDSKVWEEVQLFLPGYDLIDVTAEVIKQQNLSEVISFEAVECIEKDVENEHLWQEAKECLKKGKEAFLNTVKRLFTCAICCDLLSDPITLSCKHSFCIDCFFRSLSVNVYNCALCRVDVIHTQHYVVNENLQKALALLFNKKMSRKIDE